MPEEKLNERRTSFSYSNLSVILRLCNCVLLGTGVMKEQSHLWPCLVQKFFYKMNIVALSFVFDKYYLIID